MTVKELIKELEAIEDKSLPVIVFDDLDFCYRLLPNKVSEVIEGTEYFWQDGEGKIRKCIKIIGE